MTPGKLQSTLKITTLMHHRCLTTRQASYQKVMPVLRIDCMMTPCSEVENAQQHRFMWRHKLLSHADHWQLIAQDILQAGLP